jgi:MFS family permease
VVLLVIVPIVGDVLVKKYGFSSARKDLLLARLSAALLSAGTLLLSVSETSSLAILSFVIFALGNAYTTVARSLLTTIGPQEMVGTLLSAMNLSASLGAVIAGPIIAIAFDWGLKKGGVWVGAPLLVISLLYMLTLGFVCILSVPGKDEEVDDEPHEEAQC